MSLSTKARQMLEQLMHLSGRGSLEDIVEEALDLYSRLRLTEDASSCAKLSKRLREVLQMTAEGQSTKTIAKQLGITVKTVEAHRAKLMKTLKTRTIAGLVRVAIRGGVLLP